MKEWESVHAAMAYRGFEEIAGPGYKNFRGSLTVGDDRVPIRLSFVDAEFRKTPEVFLEGRPKWLPPLCSNLSPDLKLCYPGHTTDYIDRYEAGPMTLGVLEAAADHLLYLRRNKGAPGDMVGEFSAYWDGPYLYLDSTGGQSAPDLWQRLMSPERGATLLVTTADHRSTFEKLGLMGPDKWSPIGVFFGDLDAIPAVPSNPQWPPKNFGQLRAWLEMASPKGMRVLRAALGWMHDNDTTAVTVIFKPPRSVWFGFELSIPPVYLDPKKISKRHSFIKLALGHRMATVPIKRVTANRIDSMYVAERNLPEGIRALAGAKILLVGCGAIGSYLADALVRAGAGLEGGVIKLVDPDRFTAGNLGRNRLTYEALGLYKADALAAELKRIIPWVNVEASREDVANLGSLRDYDFVIDATGVRPVSLQLNDIYLKGGIKKIVFTWIYGNGVSAHALICADKTKGCGRCFQSAGDPTSYEPDLPENVTVNMGRGCDAPYVPYTAAPAMSAATLAFTAVLDMHNGKILPNYRITMLDKNTRQITDKTLEKIKGCPACSP